MNNRKEIIRLINCDLKQYPYELIRTNVWLSNLQITKNINIFVALVDKTQPYFLKKNSLYKSKALIGRVLKGYALNEKQNK